MKNRITKDYQNGFDFIKTWMVASPRMTEVELGVVITDAYVFFCDLPMDEALQKADWLLQERNTLTYLKFLDKVRMEFCF